MRRTYRTSGHRCPLCEGALEPELEDYDLFSGRLLGLEVLCDNCPALYEIVNSDPLELKQLDHPDSQAATASWLRCTAGIAGPVSLLRCYR